MTTALMVWGGWDGHEPERTSGRFRVFLLGEGFDVVVSDTLDAYLDRDLMGRVDLIVQTWTMGKIGDDQFEGLQGAVLRGAGFAGWHGGIIDSFRTHTGYQFMTGAQWVAHPDGIVDYTVELVRDERGHPLIAGLDDFHIRTEQYYMHMDPLNRVLATTTFGETGDAPWVEGTVMPVIWTRPWGEGRVFVNAIGHQDRDFDVPQVETVTRRGLLWAARAGRDA
jgi:type 1 glutamine amidotransferase